MTYVIARICKIDHLCKKWVMVYLLIILILLLVLIGYLLWAPIVLFIDTASGQYFLRYGVLAKAKVESDPKAFLLIRLKVFFMTFKLYPLKWKRTKKEITDKPQKKKRKLKLATMKRLVRSFRIKRFFLDIDTGDYVLNAKLFPVASLVQLTGADMTVNFEDRNRLILKIENRAFDILNCFINLKY